MNILNQLALNNTDPASFAKRYLRVLAITLAIITAIQFLAQQVLPSIPVDRDDYLQYALSFGFCFTIYVFSSRNTTIAATIVIGALLLFSFLQRDNPLFVMVAAGSVLTAATLASTPVLILTVLLVIGFILSQTVFEYQSGQDWLLNLQFTHIPYILAVILVAAVTRYLYRANTTLVNSAQRSADLLQTTTEIGGQLGQELELTPLLNRAIELISERFGYYHVQVFLNDAQGENAELVASTGAAGRLLLARKHKLAIGSRSVIGRATGNNQYVIARDDDPNNVRFRNELLPDTRAELAVPIRDGQRVIGALDVQSKSVEAFDINEVEALQTLANLLASDIRNARLFEQQQATLAENQQLVEDTKASYAIIERLNRELTGQTWRDFLRERPTQTGVIGAGKKLRPTSDWTEGLRAAASGESIVRSDGGSSHIALPMTLRGQVIGAIEVESKRVISAEELALVRAMLDRLSISLENARLYETAQAATAQESRLNQIAARYEQVNSVDDLLQITLRELGETLGAEHGAIRLGSLANEHSNGGSAS
jgi:GAF domain-containing protein